MKRRVSAGAIAKSCNRADVGQHAEEAKHEQPMPRQRAVGIVSSKTAVESSPAPVRIVPRAIPMRTS